MFKFIFTIKDLFSYTLRKKKLPPKQMLSATLLPLGHALYPSAITFELTARCNLKCRHCWWNEINPSQRKEYMSQEITLEEIKKIIDEICEFIPRIGFTGGEPFARADILEIISYAAKKKMKISVLTNATLIDQEIAKFLMKTKAIYDIGVSIDGSRTIHDRIRGVVGSFDKTINGIKIMKKYQKIYNREDLKLKINCVEQKENINDFSDLVDLAKELDIELGFLSLMWLTEDVKRKHDRCMEKLFGLKGSSTTIGHNLRLADFNVENLIGSISLAKNKAKKNGIKLSLDRCNTPQKIKLWYTTNKKIYARSGCTHPYTCRIKPNGDLVMCSFIPYSYGNLKEESFKEIWNEKKATYARRMFRNYNRQFPGCVRCCKY
ncbi:radical SAM protein [bacterium]|nr:radical SAM protein [bacterium]